MYTEYDILLVWPENLLIEGIGIKIKKKRIQPV